MQAGQVVELFHRTIASVSTYCGTRSPVCFVQVLSYNDGAYLYRLAMEPHELNATLRPDAAYAKISNERRNVHG